LAWDYTRSPDITRKPNGILEQTFIGRYFNAFVGAQHHVLYSVHSHKHMVDKPNTQSRAHTITNL